jgi:hypothetical protein
MLLLIYISLMHLLEHGEQPTVILVAFLASYTELDLLVTMSNLSQVLQQ